MSILTGWLRQIKHKLTADGYKKVSYDTSADTVFFDDDSTLSEKITTHTHNYAGASSAGGAATSANKLNTDAGSATQPVYFSGGKPVATTYTLGKSVPSDAKFTDTTYSSATTAANGLMTSAMVTKLNGIATGANAYTHPTTSGNKHIPSGGSSGQILRWSADGTAAWGSDNNTTYSNFVKSGSGAKAGLVPAPSTTAGTTKYLREDGTWAVPPDTNTTYSLSSFGITATATELNYCDGVTSNIQTQLNNKSASTHTHSYLPLTGGTLTGTLNARGIIPTTANTYNIGSTEMPYKYTYAQRVHAYSDGAQYGLLTAATLGTTATVGKGQLNLGNSTASGTDGNAEGNLVMYGSNKGYTRIIPGNNSTSNVAITLPSSEGTLALTTDTVSKATSATSATYSSTATYSKNSGTATYATNFATYKGASSATAGTKGLVPAATTATYDRFLRGDGKWAIPSKATSATSATYASTATNAGTSTYAKNNMTLRTISGNVVSSPKCHVVNTCITASSTSSATLDYKLPDVGFTEAACVATLAHEDYLATNAIITARMASTSTCRVRAKSLNNGFTSAGTYAVNIMIIGK